MSFFRYPGGKSKLRKLISSQTTALFDTESEYREPFFGGGSIGLQVLEDRSSIKKIWINDKDLGISCLWTTVINNPDLLLSLVESFEPSIDKFDEFKEKLTTYSESDLKTELELAEYGFMKLAIHQISYSGLGTKSGGPLGGRKKCNISGQGSTSEVKYPIDCRWSPKSICKKVKQLSNRLRTFDIRDNKCTNLDFTDVINDNENKAVIYLDPPYYVKGNDLYQHGFSIEDHKRLAKTLKNTNHKWILSYDDCFEIRELYNWAIIKDIDSVNYSITALKDKTTGERISRTKKELLIYNV